MRRSFERLPALLDTVNGDDSVMSVRSNLLFPGFNSVNIRRRQVVSCCCCFSDSKKKSFL